MVKEYIIKAISTATGIKDVHLETPELEEHGDYASNVAMATFENVKGQRSKVKTTTKKSKVNEYKSPRDLAKEIVKKLTKDQSLKSIVDKIEVAGPGFINFWLSKDSLISTLKQTLREKEKYGSSNLGKGKKVIVEYSSPNIAKPFTIGHLRSTIIGNAIANTMEFSGWEVYRDNHFGDWGTQFGKLIYAVKTWGNEEKIEKSDNPVKELVALYVKFHREEENDLSLGDKAREWFKKLEDGDKEARKLWNKCVEWSWKEFDKIYDALDVSFTKEFDNGRGLGESFFEDKMKVIIDELEEEKLLKKGKEGAKLVFFKNDKYPPAMILKKDGATLYHTRDLATDKYRLDNFGKDVLIINEVGSEQNLYFKQLFEMEKMLGWIKDDQRVHVGHGLIRFKDRKMSTRKGNIIWLEDVLGEAKKRAYRLAAKSGVARSEWGNLDELIVRKTKVDQELVSGQRDKDVEAVAIGALKWNDLKRDPKTNIVFDWDELLNMQGNSGPYLQYTFARTQSVLRKAETFKGETFQGVYSKLELGSLGGLKLNREEMSLLRAFPKFSEVIETAAEKYAPNLICNYLFDLAQKFNKFYAEHKILGNREQGAKDRDQEKKKQKKPITNHQSLITVSFRLALTSATGQILKNGLHLLGIHAPARM